ncbi:uncharacterized protein LOC108668762 [Hyalella azteca]|uniref:Uncharacterized protein LOC108668762 n=1 Tax=Hyalella azteca TaxID=294128 RepID=A0A8B7NDB0_HYAAZ|nr:uncharacterized protein LOC108668762 [Hyalella azteca]
MFMKNLNLDFQIKASESKLDNLFGGNQVLSDTMNHFLKQNGDLIMEEVRPALRQQWGNLLGAILKALIDSLPKEIVTDIPNENTEDRHRRRTNEKLAAKARAQAPAQRQG